MKIPALVDILQDCCAAQMEEVGAGLDWLNSIGCGWFITNWEIKINTLPYMHEDIVVSTWPYRFKGMFGFRNFTVERPDGERFAEVNSLWVFMNNIENKPARITDEMLQKYATSPQLEGDWHGRKLKLVPDAKIIKKEIVGPAQIDTNRHMNNAQYVDMSYSVLDPGVRIDCIRTEYKKPAMLGEEVVIKRFDDGNTCHVILCDSEDNVFALSEFEVEN